MPSWISDVLNASTIIRELRERVDDLTRKLNTANLTVVQQAEDFNVRIARVCELRDGAIHDVARLKDELSTVQRNLVWATHSATTENLARADAERATKRMAEQLLETSTALEEATARIATLEAELRAHAPAEQLPLVEPAADAAAEPAAPVEDKVVNDLTAIFVCQIRGLFFEGRHHWELGHGAERVKAPINDKPFLERMASRSVFFAAGDALRARMRLITYQTPAGDMYVKYSVEEVLAIIPPDQQQSLIQAPAAATIGTEGARP